MSPNQIFAQLQQRFGSSVKTSSVDAIEKTIDVDSEQLIPICKYLYDECALDLLNTVSGVDYYEADPKKVSKAGFDPHIELVYHLSSVARPGLRMVLKLRLPRWARGNQGELPSAPSVSHIWRTADWHEREVFDLLGVTFVGHPDLRRILTADDWVGHPLRKDYSFPLEYHDIRCR